MLCRTANDLYWLSRHIERVDNTARLIDLTQRTSLLPESMDPGKSESAAWRRALEALGQDADYARRYDAPSEHDVLRFLLSDTLNPASIHNCLQAAREAGRAQRVAITADMYETLNAFWLAFRDRGWDEVPAQGLAPFLEWLKRRAAAFRGVTVGTMLRDEGYQFLRLGTFLERADFAIRLLDINYGEPRRLSDAVEYYQLSALLQALSAFEAYRKIHRTTVNRVRVVDMVLLGESMPRSVAVCAGAVHDVLRKLSGERRSEALRLSGVLANELRYGRIEDYFAAGMHEALQGLMSRIHQLADEVHSTFMMPTDVIAA